MPTYEYRCKDCGHEFETVQSFTDDALTECPQCDGALRKVFGNVGISFKGSGFYKTDHGSKAKVSSGSSSESSSSSSDSGKSDSSKSESSKSESKSDSSKSDSSSSTSEKSSPSKSESSSAA